jgi:hypothetical protein
MSTSDVASTPSFQGVVYGHDGGQRIVARSEAVTNESAVAINQVVTACIHSEYDQSNWLFWARLNSSGWIAAAGFKAQDSGGRRVPGYLAIYDLDLPTNQNERDPFPLLQGLRKHVASSRYDTASGVISPVAFPIDQSTKSCQLTRNQQSLLVHILSELLKGSRCRIVGDIESDRKVEIISQLMAALPRAILDKFSFCTEISQSGHSTLQLGFCSAQVRRRILSAPESDLSEIEFVPGFSLNEDRASDAIVAARNLLRVVASTSCEQLKIRLLELNCPPHDLVRAILGILDTYENAQKELKDVWKEAHRRPIQCLQSLDDWGRKHPEEILNDDFEGKISEILDLALQGVSSLPELTCWLESVKQFRNTIDDARARRIVSLYRFTPDPDLREEFRRIFERYDAKQASPLLTIGENELRSIHPKWTKPAEPPPIFVPTGKAHPISPEIRPPGLQLATSNTTNARSEDDRRLSASTINEETQLPEQRKKYGQRWLWPWLIGAGIAFIIILAISELLGNR